jgi:hypothetical protein
LVTPSDDEAIDNIQKLTGYKIPIHDVGAPTASAADRDEAEAEPRRGRSARGGRGKSAAKPEKAPAHPAPVADAKPREDRKPRNDRKPAPAPRHDDLDGPDDGWNGPMPGFLSVGFDT